jgi:S1-C subfamily serine protease
MGGSGWRALLGGAIPFLFLSVQSPPAHAEDWALVAGGSQGDEYDMDLSSVSRTGAFVHTWVREIHDKPKQDPVTHKAYVKEIATWDNDCKDRRYLLGEQVHIDAGGNVVGREPAHPDWTEVRPDSVASNVLKVACRATEPITDKPLLDDIFTGRWISLGPSNDGKFRLALKLDEVVKLDEENVVFFTRSDYPNFLVFDDFAIKYNVSAYVLNCRTQKVAFFAADAYWTAHARAVAKRIPVRDLSMAPIPPDSYVSHYFGQICSAAAPVPEEQAGTADAGGVGVGTAWVGDKGYLITASHVITGAKRIEVYSDGEPVGKATVVVDDPANDVAILKFVSGRPAALRALEIAPHGVALGRNVFTLGYPAPDMLGQRVKMTAGQVSSTAGAEDDARFLQVSVPLQPGNSGGPIITWDGSVVGVVDFKLRKLDDDPDSKAPPPKNVNYAVKASYVRAVLEDLPDLGGYTYVKASGNHDALVAAARRAVFVLVVTQ